MIDRWTAGRPRRRKAPSEQSEACLPSVTTLRVVPQQNIVVRPRSSTDIASALDELTRAGAITLAPGYSSGGPKPGEGGGGGGGGNGGGSGAGIEIERPTPTDVARLKKVLLNLEATLDATVLPKVGAEERKGSIKERRRVSHEDKRGGRDRSMEAPV